MSNALNYAPRLPDALRRTWLAAMRDAASAAIAAARFFVTLVGCVTLVAAATIAGNAPVRDRLVQYLQTVLIAPAAGAAAVAVETRRGGQAERVVVDEKLEAEQRRVTQYLARRYRVADDAVRALVAAAYETGRDFALDPLLILAVMAIESSINPFAQSPAGAQGLMQVMTRVHTDKFEPHGGEHAALDPIANIKVGSAILRDLIRRGGSVERGLQLYVGAGNLADDGGYAARVLAERARISMAAAGRVDAAIAAGRRAQPSGDAKAAVARDDGASVPPRAAPSSPKADRAA